VSVPRSIISEPSGSIYLALLRFAEHSESLFSLAWRHQLHFADSASAIEVALRPFLQNETETSEWPGTKLSGSLAIIRTYYARAGATDLLASAGQLYAWQAPNRPEDLTFYTADGRCWLASISHERDAFLMQGVIDLRALTDAVPDLHLDGMDSDAG